MRRYLLHTAYRYAGLDQHLQQFLGCLLTLSIGGRYRRRRIPLTMAGDLPQDYEPGSDNFPYAVVAPTPPLPNRTFVATDVGWHAGCYGGRHSDMDIPTHDAFTQRIPHPRHFRAHLGERNRGRYTTRSSPYSPQPTCILRTTRCIPLTTYPLPVRVASGYHGPFLTYLCLYCQPLYHTARFAQHRTPPHYAPTTHPPTGLADLPRCPATDPPPTVAWFTHDICWCVAVPNAITRSNTVDDTLPGCTTFYCRHATWALLGWTCAYYRRSRLAYIECCLPAQHYFAQVTQPTTHSFRIIHSGVDEQVYNTGWLGAPPRSSCWFVVLPRRFRQTACVRLTAWTTDTGGLQAGRFTPHPATTRPTVDIPTAEQTYTRCSTWDRTGAGPWTDMPRLRTFGRTILVYGPHTGTPPTPPLPTHCLCPTHAALAFRDVVGIGCSAPLLPTTYLTRLVSGTSTFPHLTLWWFYRTAGGDPYLPLPFWSPPFDTAPRTPPDDHLITPLRRVVPLPLPLLRLFTLLPVTHLGQTLVPRPRFVTLPTPPYTYCTVPHHTVPSAVILL